MRTPPLAALAVVSLVPALCAQGALGAPCFVTQLGTPLNLGDDQVAPNNALGFTFPGPAGPITSIDISSNGFVWLGSNTDDGCCDGDVPTFLAGMARIAPMMVLVTNGRDTAKAMAICAGSSPCRRARAT